MTAITFDTLKFAQTLQDAGFQEIQAKSVAKAFREAQHEVDPATKADIEQLKHRVKTDGEQLEYSLKADIASVRTDIDRLENLIAKTAAETRAEIIKWVSGLAVAQVVLLAGILAKLVF